MLAAAKSMGAAAVPAPPNTLRVKMTPNRQAEQRRAEPAPRRFGQTRAARIICQFHASRFEAKTRRGKHRHRAQADNRLFSLAPKIATAQPMMLHYSTILLVPA
jgi:hypothetical protein